MMITQRFYLIIVSTVYFAGTISSQSVATGIPLTPIKGCIPDRPRCVLISGSANMRCPAYLPYFRLSK